MPTCIDGETRACTGAEGCPGVQLCGGGSWIACQCTSAAPSVDDPPPVLVDPEDANRDPATCDEAVRRTSYVGCDYWPVTLANAVDPAFDFAVVLANAGERPADVVVTGPGVHRELRVMPDQLFKIYLPWVTTLKGPGLRDGVPGQVIPLEQSIRQDGGSYHLTSTRPIVVYQFNPLEYRGAGGPIGKDWSRCGTVDVETEQCLSFTNDASLLLPTTALTGTYRIAGHHSGVSPVSSSFIAVTGTQDDTEVTLELSKTGRVAPGEGIEVAPDGRSVTFSLDAGDVVELLAQNGADSNINGSLIRATAPVQVITGDLCAYNPTEAIEACDHLEETVLPAETLGQRYIVSVPTGPDGYRAAHTVSLVGNADGTRLTFDPPLEGAPSTLDEGEVFDLGLIQTDFEVRGDKEFAISTFQVGSELADRENTGRGDPSQSVAVAVEQYRRKYIFLAPDDYDVSRVDIVMPAGATIALDGTELSQRPVQVGSTNFGVLRLPLGEGVAGAHVLEASEPVSIQVIGYGVYTSYQYPGGMNLGVIAAPPPY